MYQGPTLQEIKASIDDGSYIDKQTWIKVLDKALAMEQELKSIKEEEARINEQYEMSEIDVK